MKKKKELQPAASPKFTTTEYEEALQKETQKQQYRRGVYTTLVVMVVAAAICVLVASLLLPVLRIHGSSMQPTVEEHDIVVSLKKRNYQPGDIVALYYENRILVKRIIAVEFDTVDLTQDGTFLINGQPLEEPYISAPHYGEATNLTFPYQVPEDCYFVAGDNRKESVDSRSTEVGAIPTDDIVGTIRLIVWPLNRFGALQ